ncbi:MAG: AmmeMemoRadiSam system protein B [Elusimicrobiota bacterium]|nr:AmmeMemoRadiSam system protein B [Elusimicrobiota bacterium]
MKRIFLVIVLLCAAAGGAGAREAVVAGQFYPADKTELAAFVDAALAADIKKPAGEIVAVIAPHAGYEFSGKMAGMAYKHIADSYDTVVILATGHTEGVKGAALLAADFYQTPLGKVLPDKELAAALIKASPLFEDRPSAHEREHAVEVQLPFLQRKLKKPFKLLAAVLNTSDLKSLKTIGAVLAASLKGKKALLVISTDFSHYPGKADAAAADGAMRLAIESMDPELVRAASLFLLNKKIPGLDTCACGEAAVEAGLEAARLLGARSFHTLKLSDSYAENPRAGPDRVVGYLSGVFLKSGKPLDLQLSKEQKAVLLKEARLTLENHFLGKEPPAGLEADPRLNLPGAVFVTLTTKGQLRGCVGTVMPSMTLMDAVRYGAFSAAFRDGRFQPVKKEELAGIKIEVSVLSPLKPLPAADIKPHLHGVYLLKDGKSGLFLPQVWEQIPAKENFMGELCEQKAGLPRDCWKDPKTQLYSFTVDSFEEGKNETHVPPASAARAAAAAQ